MRRHVRTHLKIKRSHDRIGQVLAETFWQNAKQDSGLMCFMSLGPQGGSPQAREARADARDTGLAKVEWGRADGRQVCIVVGDSTVDRTLELDLTIDFIESHLPSDDAEHSRSNPDRLEQMTPEQLEEYFSRGCISPS